MITHQDVATHLDLRAKYGETTLSNFEVYMIGEALMAWVGAVVRLGHASPASTLDYTTDPESLGLGGLIVRDFVAWTSGRVELAEGCADRLRELAARAGLDAHLASSLGGVA